MAAGLSEFVLMKAAGYTVMLLDDHEIVRSGLAEQLAREPACEVIGSYSTSADLLHAMSARSPTVAIVDFSLGPDDVDGINLLRALARRFPETHVLVLSAHYNASTVSLSIRAGAAGFAGKNLTMHELLNAVRTVARGKKYLHHDMAMDLDGLSGRVLQAEAGSALLKINSLTPREREVVRCLLNGLSVMEIARKFSRSDKTISSQKKTAFNKLGVRNDKELFKLQNLIE